MTIPLSRNRAPGTVAAILMLSVACWSSDSKDPSADAVSDSTSVPVRVASSTTVVESAAPLWREGSEWKIGTTPTLLIGAQEGSEAHQLNRVAGALRSGDGTIVIANAGTSELRFFGVDGSHLRSAGGRGQGPGEFSLQSSLWIWETPTGDLAASDSGNGRVNVFADGGLASSVMLDPVADAPRGFLWGVFGDGTWLAAAPHGGGIAGTSTDSLRYLRYESSGRYLSELIRLPQRPRYVHRYAGRTHFPYVPLTAEPLVAAAGDHLYVLAGPEPELQVLDISGAVTSVVRWDAADRALATDVWEDYKAIALEGIENEMRRKLYEEYFELELPLPERVPVADALKVDADGNVWIGRFRPLDEGPISWDVIDTDGRWLGSVEMPGGLEVYQIGSTYVLGLVSNELGLEGVVMYDLLKQ